MVRNNNWFIESISLTKSTALPSKEEMEKLMPPSWPAGWDVMEKHLKDGMHSVRLGHLNPKPPDTQQFYKALADNPYISQPQLSKLIQSLQVAKESTGIDMTPGGGKYDYYATLCITGYPDKKTARQFFENYTAGPLLSLDAKVPGAAVDISIGDLLEAFAPKELVNEAKKALSKSQKAFSEAGIKVQIGRFLGEEALFIKGKNSRQVCQAVLIGNFMITGDILGYPLLPKGNEPAGHTKTCEDTRAKHKEIYNQKLNALRTVTPRDMSRLRCKCKYCKEHHPCATLATEGLIHRELVESLVADIIARVKNNLKSNLKANKKWKQV